MARLPGSTFGAKGPWRSGRSGLPWSRQARPPPLASTAVEKRTDRSLSSRPGPESSFQSTMKFCLIALAAMLTAGSSVLSAQAASLPRETTTLAIVEAIPNLPGKSLVGIVVSYPPGGATPAHHHARSAFVTGYVLSGSIRSQINHGQGRVYHAGETWTEPPGVDHEISENASATEPARLLAILAVDSKETAKLTTLDRQ